MLLGSSTTHILLASRESSLQISQRSFSVILKHWLQNLAFSFTASMAFAIDNASASGIERMKKASLCAVFLPIPGSLVSSFIRLSIIPCISPFETKHLKSLLPSEHIAQPAHTGDLQSARQLGHIFVDQVMRPSERLICGGQYKVLEHLDIFRVHHIFLYLD